MPKKRKSGGRTKGSKGVASQVQCASCSKLTTRDKAKKFTTYSSAVDYRLAAEIKAEGGYLPRQSKTVYYCVSCAIHRGRIHIRQDKERKDK